MTESESTVYSNLGKDPGTIPGSTPDNPENVSRATQLSLYMNTELVHEELNQDKEEIVYEIFPEPEITPAIHQIREEIPPIPPAAAKVPSTAENRDSNKVFHVSIMLIMDLFTLQIIDSLIIWAFPNAMRVSWLAKRIVQAILFITFAALTVTTVSLELWSDYMISSDNSFLTLGKADTTTVVLAVSFSLISVCSLAFLYIFSDILSRSKVIFRKWTLKYFKKYWVACVFVIVAYVAISLGLFISVIWKTVLNVIFLFISLNPAAIVFLCLLFVMHSITWHLAPFMLCFTVRSICKQLQHETDTELVKVKEYILGKAEIQEGIILSYYELLDRVVKLASRVKYIATLNIVTVFSMVVIIFLTSFNDEEGILNTYKTNFQRGSVPRVAYLFVSFYLIIVIMLMTQSIAKLNSKLSKFSDLILQDKEVRVHLKSQRLENHLFVDEVLKSLHYISNSKTRFKVAIFGDLTSGVFHVVLIAGSSLLIPFLIELPDFLSNFTHILS